MKPIKTVVIFPLMDSHKKTVKVNFLVSGNVTIECTIPDSLTPEQFQDGLNAGKYLVSISPISPVLKLSDNTLNDWQEIGTVTELTEVNCEYEGFFISKP